jgi:hypothetical protein
MKTMLSKENIHLAIQYALGNDAAFNNLDAGYQNLFLAILGDSNSSMLREAMVLQYLNYISYPEKHGMDGYCPLTGKQKEVKPRFINEGKKVGNSGKFNDITTELLNKKDGCDVICAAFYEGKFLYVVEFPYELIKPVLQKKVDNAVIGRRVQSDFSWKDYDSDSLRVWYFDETLAKTSSSLSKPHFDMLKGRFKA